MPIDKKIQDQRNELLERLVANPSEDELRRIQLHIDVMEKWRKLGGEEDHNHDDVNDTNTHLHHDHSP